MENYQIFQENSCQIGLGEYEVPGTATSMGLFIEGLMAGSYCNWITDFDALKRSNFDIGHRPLYSKYKSLIDLIQIDYSSILRTPQFEIGTESFFDEVEVSEEKMFLALLSNDFIVDMPPREEFSVKAKVISIETATPPIIESEED